MLVAEAAGRQALAHAFSRSWDAPIFRVLHCCRHCAPALWDAGVPQQVHGCWAAVSKSVHLECSHRCCDVCSCLPPWPESLGLQHAWRSHPHRMLWQCNDNDSSCTA
jgi:hypothetical protein